MHIAMLSVNSYDVQLDQEFFRGSLALASTLIDSLESIADLIVCIQALHLYQLFFENKQTLQPPTTAGYTNFRFGGRPGNYPSF